MFDIFCWIVIGIIVGDFFCLGVAFAWFRKKAAKKDNKEEEMKPTNIYDVLGRTSFR